MTTKPSVLILCTGNSCRSHLAEGLLRQAAGDLFEVHSAGSKPAGYVHPLAIRAMQEIGIDLSQRRPVRLTGELAAQADLVVTMGCGDRCPYIPGTRYIDWNLDDPSGKPLGDVRAIRDDIAHRVEQLVDDLGSSTTDHQTSRGAA